MNINKYKIKDNCRKNFNKYTIRAFLSIPKINNPIVLDIGCGTGVPTLALIEICNGKFYAVDSDESCLNWFQEKVDACNYSDRVQIVHASAHDLNEYNKKFDIILAEGLLNVIGFKNGLSLLLEYLKSSGYIIIHDEFKNDNKKRKLFKKNNLNLLNSFELNKDVWWNEYYSCLEKAIESYNKDPIFKSEIDEIIMFKKNPEIFKSRYYILHNES